MIVEYGFIDDTAQNMQFLNNNYKELAEAVIKAIADYKNIPYQSPSLSTQSTYTVKKGDTLYSIANQYNTTVDKLKNLNSLTNDNLSIGQILKLPERNNINYTVKKGDTLYAIATKYNTTVDELKKLNNLTSNLLSIGQNLFLPSTEIIKIPTAITTYTVKKGDTLYSIAKKYNTTVDKIKLENNLKSDLLTIGQIINIPTTQTITIPSTTNTYIVKPGDTLYSIANQYNTTINTIKQLNNLTTNLLSVGQSLIIQ